jgi:23S rRNA U2552 (ribose-2'-O)-methylase RlmE/FtsJ
VLDLIPARSAIDVGCANGTWAQTLLRHMDDVVGVDGDWVSEASRGSWFSA